MPRARPSLLPLLATLTLLAGCAGEHAPLPLLATCEHADGERREVDLSHTVEHCMGCGIRCMLPGVRAADQHCDDGCRLAPDTPCAPGYLDADGDPFNGCECRGADPATCVPCAAEVPFNGVDDDCDLRADEQVPPAQDIRPPTLGGGYASVQPDRPNGPEGAIVAAPTALTRLVCGDAPCALPPGALDVRCVTRGFEQICEPIFPPGPDLTRGDLPSGDYPGRQKRGPEVDCTDGIDGDGNGIIDDGPNCETLVPAVAHPECHGQPASRDCPPAWVPLAGLPGLFGTDGPTVAVMTYDALIDDREATVGQVQRWLWAAGRCDRLDDESHPLCRSDADPQSPAGYLNWCDAYAYCQAIGKRLPTELEWVRAFGGHLAPTFEPADPVCRETEAQAAECKPDGPRPVGQPGGHVDQGVGYTHRTFDVAGNIAEWLFDATRAVCELPWIGCRGDRWQYATPLDPVVHAPDYDLRRPRILRGGGYGSEYGAAAPDARQWADPGARVPHYGVRCARTFEPQIHARFARLPDPQRVPYDRRASDRFLAECKKLPLAGRIARRTPDWLGQAVDACIVSPFEPEPLRVVVEQLAWPSRPLLLNIEETQSGSAVIFAAPGLVPGVEALWLADYPPLESYHRAHCGPTDCRFRLDAPWPWAVELPDESEAIIYAAEGHALKGSESCLGSTHGLVVWAFEVEVPRTAFDLLPEPAQHTDAACIAFGCAHALPEGERCVDACEAWRVPIHVGFDRLTVP